jgi:riboflavin kinase
MENRTVDDYAPRETDCSTVVRRPVGYRVAVVTFLIEGTVTSGLGRGREFVTLDGYARQFRNRLGYEPYPGTLNLDLPRSVKGELERLDPVRIDGWEEGGDSFGAVDCYPASVVGRDQSARLHTIVPVRTDHDASTLELISPVGLRDRFGLCDHNSLEIRVKSVPSES